MRLHPLTAETAQSVFASFHGGALGAVATLQNVPAICNVADR
jgi:hypothetical protein